MMLNLFSFVCLFTLILETSIMSKLGKKIVSVEFEVFGKVQGVFFRKYTQQESTKLGLKGWCMNTEHGTVQGIMQGDADKINEMKIWLQYKGSPASRIEKAEFRNEKEIKCSSFSDFKVRR